MLYSTVDYSMSHTHLKMSTKQKALNWTQVKNQIQDFSREALLDLIHHLYKASDLNKAFLTARFQPDATLHSKELVALKKRIYRLMCPNIRSSNNNPNLREGRKIISDYKKTGDVLGTLDLMLVYVEAGNEFTQCYGDNDAPFYDSLCNMMAAFAKLFQQNPQDYRPFFQERLQHLYRASSGIGWGYSDDIRATLESIDIP